MTNTAEEGCSTDRATGFLLASFRLVVLAILLIAGRGWGPSFFAGAVYLCVEFACQKAVGNTRTSTSTSRRKSSQTATEAPIAAPAGLAVAACRVLAVVVSLQYCRQLEWNLPATFFCLIFIAAVFAASDLMLPRHRDKKEPIFTENTEIVSKTPSREENLKKTMEHRRRVGTTTNLDDEFNKYIGPESQRTIALGTTAAGAPLHG
jgi:hypothetical protein